VEGKYGEFSNALPILEIGTEATVLNLFDQVVVGFHDQAYIDLEWPL
jgi:hypothetical protein